MDPEQPLSVIEVPLTAPMTARTKPKYVRLDGVDFRPRGPVQFELTNIHARPISLGDPGPTNHPTNSTITQHSWVGGGQITYANPNSDMERFDWATCLTEYPHYLTLGPQTFTYTPDATATFSMCLGDCWFNSPVTTAQMTVQIGDKLWFSDPATDTMTGGTLTLTVAAVNAGTIYRVQSGIDIGQNRFFIPGGTGGYDIYTGSAIIHKDGIKAVEFAVWDNKLFALDVLGRLYWALDPMSDVIGTETGGVPAANWVLAGSISDGSDPRHLVNFLNKAGEDTLWVTTSNDAWGLDFTNKRLVRSYFGYPRHPHQGWGSEHWRGELWVSVGMGAHRYDLNQVIPSGVDRDMGPPKEYRGYVKDIVGSYNLLFMYIVGSDVGTTAPEVPEDYTLDVGFTPIHADADASGGPAGSATNNLIVAWNGDGYHYRWAGPGVSPGNMYVSQAGGRYELWWANDGKVLRQALPIDYFNPMDPFSPAYTHAPESTLETPWFDWGWTDQVKLWKRLEVGVRRASPDETIRIEYKIDGDVVVDEDGVSHDNPWRPMTPDALITHPGRYVYSLGLDLDHQLMPDGSACYEGLPHSHFKLKFTLRRGDNPQARPVLDWWSAIGRKILNPIRTWRFSVDCTTQQMGNYPGGSFQKLQALAMQNEAFQFDIEDEHYMVEMVALNGPKDVVNQEKATFMSVHLIEANDLPVATPETVIIPEAGP